LALTEPDSIQAFGAIVRRWRRADVAAILRIQNDDEVRRFVAGAPFPYTREHAEQRIRLALEPVLPGDKRTYAVVPAGSDDPAGAILIDYTDPPEVGYAIEAAARSRGLATAALRAVSEWLLNEHWASRVELVTHPDNVASQCVALKAGFVRAGEVDDYAEWLDGTRRGLRFTLQPD
jgi:RimJ/RimL family protein N-acetyltransferase